MANRPNQLSPQRGAALPSVEELAREARGKLPRLVRQMENLLRTVDPIELLSQLTLLYQTHVSTEVPNREETARRQVQLEWLVWLVFARGITSPPNPRFIDARVLEPLHRLLDEYYSTMTIALAEPVEGLSDVQNELRMLAQLDALCVRGEMFHAQLERMAFSLYSPHDDWCIQNLNFTVSDAWTVANSMLTRIGTRMGLFGAEAARLAERVRAHPKLAAELDLPANARDILSDRALGRDSATLADFVKFCWFFSKSPEIVGFTVEELQDEVGTAIDPRRVASVVEFMSSQPEDFREEPDPLALSPLAARPVIRHNARHYVFVPALVLQSVVHAFHTALYRDANYRPQYDEARAQWLERSAVDALCRMLPNADSGWGLTYGPKKQRLELDGLIRYANKLVLVECKWKSQTLLARRGDVVAALKDVDKAILEPLRQAKRARTYISQHGSVTFEETSTGRSLVVDQNDVGEVFLVTLVGAEAWSQLAANLVRLAPLGLFSDGEYPWALSLNDLRVVADHMELPSQLFDYLRRRDEVQRDAKFRLHDEWDLLGAYLNGALDVCDPQFEGLNFVAFQGFDDDIHDYYYRNDVGQDPGKRPRRELPAQLVDLLNLVEHTNVLERTDAICVVLSWPNRGLLKLAKALDKAQAKTESNGRTHAVAVRHPWRSYAVAFACGIRNRGEILNALAIARKKEHRRGAVTEWVGFGIDLATPGDVAVIYERTGGT